MFVYFLFSKTKMFKLLFILFVIKKIIGQRIIGCRYFFGQAKYYPTRENWVVIIQVETLHTSSVLIFAGIYFCELKKIVFREYLFLRMTSFWKFRVYELKKKTVESRDIPLIFCQDQRKGRQVTMEKLLLLIGFEKKTELTNILCICAYFLPCICSWEVWIFCIISVYLFLKMPFQRKLCVYLILRNFVKKYTCEN